MLRFIDANIFVHSRLETSRKLSDRDLEIKKKASDILKKIEAGQEAVISVVHISEIANILRSFSAHESIQDFLISLFTKHNIIIDAVTKEDYMIAINLSGQYKININDCLALVIMKKNNIREIYSFDKDFDKIDDISRIEE